MVVFNRKGKKKVGKWVELENISNEVNQSQKGK